MSGSNYSPSEICLDIKALHNRNRYEPFAWLTGRPRKLLGASIDSSAQGEVPSVSAHAPCTAFSYELEARPRPDSRYVDELVNIAGALDTLLKHYNVSGVPSPLAFAGAAMSKTTANLYFIEGFRIPVQRPTMMFFHPQRMPAGGLRAALSLSYIQKTFQKDWAESAVPETNICQEFLDFMAEIGLPAASISGLANAGASTSTEEEELQDIFELFMATPILLHSAGLASLVKPIVIRSPKTEDSRSFAKAGETAALAEATDEPEERIDVDLASVSLVRSPPGEAKYLKKLIDEIQTSTALNLDRLKTLVERAQKVSTIMSIDQSAALEGATIAAQFLNNNADDLRHATLDVGVLLYAVGCLLVRATNVPFGDEVAISEAEAAGFQQERVPCSRFFRNLSRLVTSTPPAEGTPIGGKHLRSLLDGAKKGRSLASAVRSELASAEVADILGKLSESTRDLSGNNTVPGILRVGDIPHRQEAGEFLASILDSHPEKVVRTLLEIEFPEKLERSFSRSCKAIRKIFPYCTHFMRATATARAMGVTWKGLDHPKTTETTEGLVNGAKGFAHLGSADFEVGLTAVTLKRVIPKDGSYGHNLPLEPATISELQEYWKVSSVAVITIFEIPANLNSEFIRLIAPVEKYRPDRMAAQIQAALDAGRANVVSQVEGLFRKLLRAEFEDLHHAARDRDERLGVVFEKAVSEAVNKPNGGPQGNFRFYADR